MTNPIVLIVIVGILLVAAGNYIFSTRRQVIRLLRKHGINYQSWVKSVTTNSLEDLVKSVRAGECELHSLPDGRLVLHINVAVVTVICSRCKSSQELREFRNGEHRPFNGSLGEKIRTRYSETAIQAAKRGLREELGKTEPLFKDETLYTIRPNGWETKPPQPSEFYPGLYDEYARDFFLCDIQPPLCHNRYIAEDNGRHIHFYWIETPQNA